jgi:hypothetical protein
MTLQVRWQRLVAQEASVTQVPVAAALLKAATVTCIYQTTYEVRVSWQELGVSRLMLQ